MEKYYIVYNCGYYPSYNMVGGVSGKRYRFVRGMATEVEKLDYSYFLGLTSSDVPWCQKHSKCLKPFMNVEDWCSNKEGKYNKGVTLDPKEFLNIMLLKQDA